MTDGYSSNDSEFEFFDEDRQLTITVNAIPARLGPQQSTGYPAKILIAALPALHIPADNLDSGKRGLDEVRTAQRSSQTPRQPQTVHSQCLLQTFFQTPRRARIQMHQLRQQTVQRAPGIHI